MFSVAFETISTLLLIFKPTVNKAFRLVRSFANIVLFPKYTISYNIMDSKPITMSDCIATSNDDCRDLLSGDISSIKPCDSLGCGQNISS